MCGHHIQPHSFNTKRICRKKCFSRSLMSVYLRLCACISVGCFFILIYVGRHNIMVNVDICFVLITNRYHWVQSLAVVLDDKFLIISLTNHPNNICGWRVQLSYLRNYSTICRWITMIVWTNIYDTGYQSQWEVNERAVVCLSNIILSWKTSLFIFLESNTNIIKVYQSSQSEI